MSNVNINRSVTDTFYRYKMPRIIAKVEGKGNGIKTVIENMPAVAKSLQRPPTYPTKYFGCELGAQTQFDLKNERFIVNGAHDASKLQDLLDGFIKRFVLCEECDNPETFLTVRAKKNEILSRCIACGHQSNIDMRHKLTTFMVKNPPENPEYTGSTTTPNKNKEKEDKKKEKGGKKGKKEVNGDAKQNGEEDDAGSPVEDIPGELTAADDDWGDTSAAAVAARQAALTDAAKSLALNDDLEKTQQERMNIMYDYIKTRETSGECSSAKAGADIVGEAERLDVKEKVPLLLVELLFDENILVQIKKYRNLLLRFTHENKKSQKYLLGGLEQLIGNVHHDILVPKVAHVLKLLYDLDVLEEEVLLEWGSKISKKYVDKVVAKEIHDKAQPFIKWLQEAESESSEEDEDDSDIEITYDERAPVGVVKTAAPAAKQDDEEDDFDIDAI